jgi:2'-5' RNA ligase
MSRLRTFLAVPLDKSLRDRAVTLQEKLAATGAQVKWVEPENLHLTLLFLGEVDERDLASVCKATAQACAAVVPFRLSLEGVGGFPNLRRPRTLWIGSGEGSQELCVLHDALERPLLELGCYRREERAFTPHLTLGRVKSDRPNRDLELALTKQAAWKGGDMLAREVLVLSSQLTPRGPVYSLLSRAKFASEH